MLSASRSFYSPQLGRLLASGLLVLLSMPALFAASPIVDTNGFETGFVPGALHGQDGWLKTAPGGDTSTATIQSLVVASGSKALKVERAANSYSRWLKPAGGLGVPTHRFVLVDWDMNVTATGAISGAFGPFLGVDTYDDTGTPSVLGSLGVDATTGEVLYQAPSSGVVLATGTSIGFGDWHHFQIKLDFGLDQYQMLVDGNVLQVAAGGQLHTAFAFVDGASDKFTDADIAAFSVSADSNSQSQTATAYFDNFLVRDISPADFDIDADVDGTDLSIWEGAYQTTLAADSNLDGDSDGSDFLLWQREFDPGTGALTAAATSVPEPSSLMLATLMLAAMSLGFFLRPSIRPSLRLCR